MAEFPKVIVVTGAAAGVGRAVVMRFARSRVKLGLISRDRDALNALAEEVKKTGSACAIAAIDVSDAEAVERAADQFERELGAIDLWVNDAMLTVFSTIHDITADEFRRVTEVTYLGVVHGCMAATKRMRARKRGHIVNIGSALAYRGIPLQSAYCGAKHAIRGFTASLRTELLHDKTGISVSLMELPAMNTPQFDWARTHRKHRPRPMGTIYQPETAAEAVFRAARTHPFEYWVGFSTLMTIVGNMVAPEFMDWFLARSAVEGQETDEEIRPDRKDNLFEPVTALHRTHGVFGSHAKPKAMIVSGAWMRAIIIACGAILFFAAGAGVVAGVWL